MDIFWEVLLFLIGLVLLVIGGDKFVDESLWLARRFRISELIIGATIVSIGTTLPELIVSATAAVKGSSDIAFGNAIGSIICNTGLIVGIVLLLKPPFVVKKGFTQGSAFFYLAAAIYIGAAVAFGEISRPVSAVLILIFIIYMFWNIFSDRSKNQPQNLEVPLQGKIGGHLLKLVICAVVLFAGSQLLVNSAVSLAGRLAIPEKVIALSCVALGTSLPELVTAIVSIRKGHTALSVGNVLGANFINIVLVSGVSSLILPTVVDAQTLVTDIVAMVVLMLIFTLPILWKSKGFRYQGGVLLIIYAVYIFRLFSA